MIKRLLLFAVLFAGIFTFNYMGFSSVATGVLSALLTLLLVGALFLNDD